MCDSRTKSRRANGRDLLTSEFQVEYNSIADPRVPEAETRRVRLGHDARQIDSPVAAVGAGVGATKEGKMAPDFS
jgi:hypothetical protein